MIDPLERSRFARAAAAAGATLALLAAGPAPHGLSKSGAMRVVQDATEAPDAAPAPAPSHAGNLAIAEGFLELAYGADPASGIPARTALARFSGDVRAYVSGSEADRQSVARTMTTLSRLTKTPMRIVAGEEPNLFVAVTDRPAETFGGPLRKLLELALTSDEEEVNGFIAKVVDKEGCWVLPVWTDASRTLIKASVVGIDARMGRVAVDRCIFRKMSASLGLLGAGVTLQRSMFNPTSGATRPSFEDQLMLRVLESPGIPTGLEASRARPDVLAAVQRTRPR